jgi:hypothetical protein
VATMELALHHAEGVRRDPMKSLEAAVGSGLPYPDVRDKRARVLAT